AAASADHASAFGVRASSAPLFPRQAALRWRSRFMESLHSAFRTHWDLERVRAPSTASGHLSPHWGVRTPIGKDAALRRSPPACSGRNALFVSGPTRFKRR